MVDKTLILRKLSDLDEHLNNLSEFQDLDVEKYSNDWKVQRIIERTLQIMIELCVDIANHIIGDQRYRVPNSYSDTFKILGEEKILDAEICLTMQDMAKFRNIVVHGYDKINQEIVLNILHNKLNDYVRFKEVMLNYLK